MRLRQAAQGPLMLVCDDKLPVAPGTCVECRAAPVRVAFVPCGHLMLCEECSRPVTVCPRCLAAVERKVKTFE